MRKQQILKRMSQIINKDKEKRDKLKKQQIEEVVECFKQVMLECIQNGDSFVYRGFLEVETRIVKPKKRVNPKTREAFISDKGYKVNVRLVHTVKQFIKTLTVK